MKSWAYIYNIVKWTLKLYQNLQIKSYNKSNCFRETAHPGLSRSFLLADLAGHCVCFLLVFYCFFFRVGGVRGCQIYLLFKKKIASPMEMIECFVSILYFSLTPKIHLKFAITKSLLLNKIDWTYHPWYFHA